MASEPVKHGKDREAMSPWQIAWPAIVGWFVPGLGHILIGDKKRGSIVAVGIIGLWLIGLLVGGITVIDCFDNTEPESDRKSLSLPFFAQVGVAPTLVLTAYHRNQVAALGDRENAPGAGAGYEPSFGRVFEQGVLLTSLAGMLNLMAVLDLLMVGLPKNGDEADEAATETGERAGAPSMEGGGG